MVGTERCVLWTAGALTLIQFVLMLFFSVGGIPVLRVVGVVLWLISLILGWLPVATLRWAGNVGAGKSYIHTEHLVDTGVYGIIRHPQYVALPVVNVGLALISQHWLVILVGVPAFVLACVQIGRADEEGITKFGDEYREYMKRVPRANFVIGVVRAIQRGRARTNAV
jgi:protein-S-isoprenylcysteine O-methyltransferase Ste14